MRHFFVLGNVEEERYAFAFATRDTETAQDIVEHLLAHEYVPTDLEGFPINADDAYQTCVDEGYRIEVLLLVESDAPIYRVRGV